MKKNDKQEEPCWLNESDFLQKYRMHRESFEQLHDMIKDHPVFNVKGNTRRKGRNQSPARNQLACFLRYIGTEGSGCSNAGMRQVFRFGRGSFPNFIHRCCTAICSLKDQAVTWPDEDERKRIAKRFFDKFGFPNCVGIADGTLFPFAFRPETEDAPDYKGRKLGYTLTCMVICDDERFIRYYLTGWPGSVHDNRIFRLTKLSKMPGLYFSFKEYLLGDSAFENQWFMVSAFKNLPGVRGGLTREKETFNTALGRARVISEHCIGLLKGRFPWLRHMRRVIKRLTPRQSMRQILRLIDCCVILHNLLLARGDDEMPDNWDDDNDDSSAVDSPTNRLPTDDTLNLPIPGWASADERRSQLCDYVNETFIY
jgi:hypothetical protein